MLRFFLAAIIFAAAAFGPAAAYAPAPHAQMTAETDDQDCACCERGQIGAAMACAAYCQAALPSSMTPLPQFRRADLALSLLNADGDGVAIEPPAPPPRL